MSADILVEPDVAGVVKKLSTIIEEHANKSIQLNGIFKIGLSGGSLVKFLSEALPGLKTDWTKWRFFFCDERLVPFDDQESTYGLYRASLIGKIPIDESQFVTVDPELSAEDAAKDYIKKMCVYFAPHSLPRFDVLLLGMGPDGHTCSLFPDHRLLDESILWVCPITDSPKPPPCRITLTLPVINSATLCIFAVTGASKANMVKRVWESKEKLPAALVQPSDGQLIVILDKEAASSLSG